MNILVIGQTTLHWGRMEYGNIGNYYIIEPFFRELRKQFNNPKIKTTLQMSERFCKAEHISLVPMELYYDFKNENNLYEARKEIELIDYYLETGQWRETTSYIKELLASDLVIDFSGDIWGDNADFLGKDRFEVGLLKNLAAQKLSIPTFMLAGSPGPFNNINLLDLAKQVYSGFNGVTNREPISTKLLDELGFDLSRTETVPCPSFIFEPIKNLDFKKLLSTESDYIPQGPVVGFILCGWNFFEGPYDKWPRDNKEYDKFIALIEYFLNENPDVTICLMSHSNGFPVPPLEFKLIHGRDYPVIKQVESILISKGYKNRIITLNNVYDAWTTKAIIGNFDMLISGRVHGAIAGLSQSVPTVILDYGHEPKAHKLLGFATVAGQREYIADSNNLNDMIAKTEECWNNKKEIKMQLKERMLEIQEETIRNFTIIKENLIF